MDAAHSAKTLNPLNIHALYVHVPFCFHKCHYCDFYSLVEAASESRTDLFLDALTAEFHRLASVYEVKPKTLFVGGGTPTLLPTELWRSFLGTLAEAGALVQVQEFTVEANPETVNGELAEVLAAGGVNRVSIGAQSFQPRLLKALERWHEVESVGRAAEVFRRAGIANINFDLIFAIPGQTMAELEADLDAVLALEPMHLSCYSLIFEPHTPLTQKLKMGRVSPVGEEMERRMYERVLQRLDEAGFEHYEVSNFARRVTAAAPGQERAGSQRRDWRCQHNMAYWMNANWLGIGPSAASHVEGRRWKNEAHLGRYIAGAPRPPVVDEEFLPAARRVGEQMMLLLRLREGAALHWLERALDPTDRRWDAIAELIAIGMLERTATHLRLTHAGLFVADSVIAKLL
jgi:oxygen-independent coproporphyrinogen-3 oxidase